MALGPARNGDETAQVDVMVLCSPEMLEELDSLIALAEAQIAHLRRLLVGPAMPGPEILAELDALTAHAQAQIAHLRRLRGTWIFRLTAGQPEGATGDREEITASRS